jgi:hypothetical protein
VLTALHTSVGQATNITDLAPARDAPSLGEPYGLAMLTFGIVLVTVAFLTGRAWQWLRIAAWRGRLPGRAGALPTETRASHERPHGYKVARLVADPTSGTGEFLGATFGGLYSHDSTAVCEVLEGTLPPPRRWGRRSLPRSHEAPEIACSCGFYVLRDRSDATELLSGRPPISRLFGVVLLEVDLSGTVIEFDHGFRASHQRVLGVQVPRWCLTCATDGRARPAERLAGLSGRDFEEACKADVPQHPPLYRLAVLVHHQQLMTRLGERAALRPVCDAHTPRKDPSAGAGKAAPIVLELADLAAQLGTEVRWLDDDDFAVRRFVETMTYLPPGHPRAA